MDWHGWFTIAVVVLVLAVLVRELASPWLTLMAGLVTLAAGGVLTPAEAFDGFDSHALIVVGVLFVVSAAMRETGALELTAGRLLDRAGGVRSGLLRICPPVSAFSAFLNNAPIVAMMTPLVLDWARRRGHPASRFLIPLSYASILGSTTTLIGTSTTLLVAGLLTQAGMPEMGFFELLPAGLPILVVGLLYLLLVAPHRLPERLQPSEELGARRREYTASMIVQAECPLVGQTIEAAGLRQLPGLFVVEIDRAGRIVTPVAPDEEIHRGDRLVFAGVLSTIVELQRIRGLVPAADDEAPSPIRPEHRLVEAVVSPSSPLVGQSIRDASFRTVYDAAVIAVHRNGAHVPGKIGSIALQAGDTLLLQGARGFQRAHRNSPDFYLVSEVRDSDPRRHDRAWAALAILGAMVGVVALEWQPIAIAAPLAAGAMIAARCITGPIALRSVDWSILIVIGAGLGLARAMEKTGAAAALAELVVGSAGQLGPYAALVALYLFTLTLAELLHHTAAVAIVFPVSVAAAAQLGVDPRPFVMGTTLAGICAFASPVTYQTHLIVYGPGGYRFTDFVRAGLPLDALCAAVALGVIPLVWPL